MKIAYDWLKELINVTEDIHDLSKVFYTLGFGVESIQDDILDLEITPNRGDALSIYGLAREYAAYKDFKIDKYKYNKILIDNETNDVQIKISTDKITSYFAIVIEDVVVSQSSQKIQKRLKKVDINVINNIVDITNYIMYETGIPLHAYDLDKINNDITIKTTEKEELLKTLNNKEYKLPIGSLTAYDGEKIIDLIGIQGGMDVAVDNNTKKILLHAPNVNNKLIRKTSKKINLNTSASYRLERGIDNELLEAAVSKASELIRQGNSCKITQIIDKRQKIDCYKIAIDWKNILRVLGTDISKDKSIKILNNLGFDIKNNIVEVPDWRIYDINYEEDLIEEIARIYGYNNLKSIELSIKNYQKNINDDLWDSINELSSKLINNGFDEVMTYSFISQQHIDNKDNKKFIEIDNPLSSHNQYLRHSMVPLLLEAAEQNIWMPDINFFEIGTNFYQDNETINVALISTKKINFIKDIIKIDKFPNGEKTKRIYYVYEGSIDNLNKTIPENNKCIRAKKEKYKQFSKYPSCVRDISFIVKDRYVIQEIISKIYNENILSINIVDIYKSERFNKDNTSYCIRIIFDNKDNKLSNEDIEKTINQIIQILENKYFVKIR